LVSFVSTSLAASALLVSLALASSPLAAQEDRVVVHGAEVIGDPVTPHIFYGDVRDLPTAPQWQYGDEYIVNPRRWFGEDTSFFTPATPDPLLERQAQAAVRGVSSTTLFAFQGLDFGASPPDPTLDVGSGHVIQIVNASNFIIYDKATGATLAGPTALDSLGTGACASGRGDPVVIYDALADRWVMSEFSSGLAMCVYVSMTNDPVTGGWCSYLFGTSTDYPKYAVWPDAYYVTTNEGNVPPVYAFDRENMLTCGTARPIQKLVAPGLPGLGFEAFTPGDLDGPTLPPAGSPAYFMRHRDTELGNQGPMNPTQDILELWQMQVDWTTPANTTLTQLPDILVSEFDSNLCPPIGVFSCIPQPGTTTRLDPLLEVIMNRLSYRNFGSHQMLLGVLQTDIGDFEDHSGERWFELRKTGAGPWSLFQEGTFSPDADHRFMGTVAMDGDGNILLGYALSSTTTNPSIAFTGRHAADPAGTMTEPEQVLIAGVGNSATSRYGDYSQMGIDPVDDCTFWFTVEYAEGVSNTTTGIGAVKFDGCTGLAASLIFSDGFESGNTSAWSNVIP